MTFFTSQPVKRLAMLSVHTCPLAMLGGKKTGGMNVYVRDFARELCRRGIQVDIFTRSQDDCVPMVIHELAANGRVIHVKAGPERPMPVPEVAKHIDTFAQGVIDYAAAEGIEYDIIHSHYWLSGLVAEKLRDAWGEIPIIQMFHTLGHMKNAIARDDRHRAPKSRIDGEMHVIHHVADTIIAATPAEESQLIELYGAKSEKIAIIPPGVDLNRFERIDKHTAKMRVGLPEDKHNILLVGRIEPLKGIDTLLKAVALVDKEWPTMAQTLSVTIVGGDPHADTLDAEMERLQTLRSELQIEHMVTFVGSKDQMILPNYYAASEMTVMPSHYESFGLVALESMAMGTPVVASEVGGLAWLVENSHTGYHIPARSETYLAKAIHQLMEDSEKRAQMSHCAHEVAKRYSWPRIVDHMIQLYGSLMPTTSLKFVRGVWFTGCDIPGHEPAVWRTEAAKKATQQTAPH